MSIFIIKYQIAALMNRQFLYYNNNNNNNNGNNNNNFKPNYHYCLLIKHNLSSLC